LSEFISNGFCRLSGFLTSFDNRVW
jgi:hypothetical protein